MGIWVKCQDGTLGIYTKFLPPVVAFEKTYDDESIVPITTDKVLNARVVACDLFGRLDTLGEYASKEEALRVLSRIEDHIFNYEYEKASAPESSKYFKPIFYMPDSGFSESEAK